MLQDPIQVIQYRPLLFSIGYNMLGSIMDAEDMVQDTMVSWLKIDHSKIENPRFYLVKAITNRCINRLKELQRNRESYIGTWLPEPLVGKTPEFYDLKSDRQKELSIGFLYLLEKLNPLERGVLILKESFDLANDEIIEIFGISADNCRQLLSRAKAKLKLEKRKFNADKQKHTTILQKFLQACMNGDMQELISLLKEDVVFYSDGGGKASAALKPLHGKEIVLKFIHGIIQKTGPVSSIEFESVNGLSGAIIYLDSSKEVPDLVVSLDINEEGKIQNLYFIRNPEKLQRVRS
jgi:RNA polymerase sigma-70 factor (ECF subfamily)